MTKIRVGVQIHPQHTTYPAFAEAVKAVENAGVDTIWNWDHFYPLSGDPDGLHFEGWTTLTAMAMLTSRAEVGCLVTCNSYRNPNLLADMARTLDHISGGRLILGIGAGWFEKDYTNYGYEFGTAPDRLKWLRTSLPIIKERFEKLNPPPTRDIPILIGGGGEKVTLKLTAQYATMWNGFGPVETFARKNQVLNEWCSELGRDPSEIERTVALRDADEINDLPAYIEAGATHFILGLGAPFDIAPVERLVKAREAL
ncbi:LLM class F420-dependent oxidoreductase [Chloroflexia bacterium SDU3-3]|nr:LLM class F420-dependent oxidoreductase [Chloroflexia bacterium SDU3-3]